MYKRAEHLLDLSLSLDGNIYKKSVKNKLYTKNES